jgi:hypothetical protein
MSEDSRLEELEAFLNGLTRAQVEQGEPGKRIETDWLNQKLHLLCHNEASPEDLLQQDHTQNLSLPTYAGRQAGAMHKDTEQIATRTVDPNGRAFTPQRLIETKFWSLERGQ